MMKYLATSILLFLAFSCSKVTEYDYSRYDHCIIVDYALPSSAKRLFIKVNGKIIDRFLVCSGRTDEKGQVIFSNEAGSHCSSLGKVRILSPYHGQFGKAYKLQGLDETNSNIYRRNIVLHCHSCVPGFTLSSICESQGCFTVNCRDFRKIDSYIQKYHIPYLYCIQSNLRN
ncbi:MAG: hypothetical protein FJY10_11465 [Bacteroidetes bacterium]|nr:hypothetical protein [Bacteroidota bacterium]